MKVKHVDELGFNFIDDLKKGLDGEKIDIVFKFRVGTTVIDLVSNRVGTVTKQWSKTVKRHEGAYFLQIFYTVTPEIKSYNSFRVPECILKETFLDDNGDRLIILER